jgi:hypothetical protein
MPKMAAAMMPIVIPGTAGILRNARTMTTTGGISKSGIDGKLGVDAGEDLVDGLQVGLTAAIKKAQGNLNDQGDGVADDRWCRSCA